MFDKLRATGHDIVDISLAQMTRFAGNVLELAAPGGHAHRAVDDGLAQPGTRRSGACWNLTPICSPVSIPTIERIGGGGVRCMLAEIHLPKRRSGRAHLRLMS